MTTQKLHTAVWAVRAEIGHTWLTPSPLDCLRYAFTEAGEAMDAHLRQQRPDDARNSVLDELGDCAIMLASALGPDISIDGRAWTGPASLDEIALDVTGALDAATIGDEVDVDYVEWALRDIYSYPGFTTEIALARLERIRGKYTK